MKKLQTREDQEENALPCRNHTVAKQSGHRPSLKPLMPSKQKPGTCKGEAGNGFF